MKRNTSFAAAAVLAAVLLAGCSSQIQGSPEVATAAVVSTTVDASGSTSSTAHSTTTDSTTTDTSATDSSTTETTGSSSSESTISSDDTSRTDRTSTSGSSAAPASLDATTQKWFTVFCGGAADLQQYVSPDTTGQTLTQAQDTVVKTYTNISKSASTTVGVLQATRPPTVAGGDDLQSIAIERFTAVSDVYGRGAQTIAALTPRSTSDLKSAVDAIEAEAKASTPNSMASVDPGVVAAARALPACKKVLG